MRVCAQQVAPSEAFDFVVRRVEPRDAVLDLAPPPSVGDPVFVVGHPNFRWLTEEEREALRPLYPLVSRGNVVRVDGRSVVVDAPCYEGNSGGALPTRAATLIGGVLTHPHAPARHELPEFAGGEDRHPPRRYHAHPNVRSGEALSTSGDRTRVTGREPPARATDANGRHERSGCEPGSGDRTREAPIRSRSSRVAMRRLEDEGAAVLLLRAEIFTRTAPAARPRASRRCGARRRRHGRAQRHAVAVGPHERRPFDQTRCRGASELMRLHVAPCGALSLGGARAISRLSTTPCRRASSTFTRPSLK